MKIVVSGYGTIAPNTRNIDEFLFNLQHGVNTLELIDGEGYKGESNIVGLIDNGLEELEKDRRINRLPKVSKLGIVAGKEALKSAGVDLAGKKVGVFFGTSLGSITERPFQDSVIHINNDEYRKVPITFPHYVNYHSITSSIAYSLGAKGITRTITTGCTSSLEAIESALLYLRSGKIDIAIVGGTESSIDRTVTYAFARTRVLPLDQEMKDGAVPFQEDSKGFAIAEAAGAIVLEREEDALLRGASIKGEFVDAISNNDGIYIYSTDETGEEMVNVLKEITNGRSPDYINSQALGIQINDRIEERCSRELFNHQTPYTSIKSMFGNPLAASGILQVISSLLSVEHNFIPPTIRTTKKGYEDMNIVTETIYQEVNEVAITNHGHGGNNACAYIQKYRPNHSAMERENT